jgi:hypothetical protein
MAADNTLMAACLRVQSQYRARRARRELRRKIVEDARRGPALQKRYDPLQLRRDREAKAEAEEELLAEMVREARDARVRPWESPSKELALRNRDNLLFQVPVHGVATHTVQSHGLETVQPRVFSTKLYQC